LQFDASVIQAIFRLISIIEEGEVAEIGDGHRVLFNDIVANELVGRFTLLTVANCGASYSIHRLMRMVVKSRDEGIHCVQACRNAVVAVHATCRLWTYQSVVDAGHDERAEMMEMIPHMRSVCDAIVELNEGGSGAKEAKSKSDAGVAVDALANMQPRKSRLTIDVRSPAEQTTLLLATINRAEGFLHQFTSNYNGTATSTSFWTISRAFLSSARPHTRRTLCSTWSPC